MVIPKWNPSNWFFSLQGISGKSYGFTGCGFGNEPKYGGVYVVVRKDESLIVRPYIIYIGEARNIHTRFQNHEKQDCFDKEGAEYLATCKIEDKTERKEIQDDLIANYRAETPCNKEYPNLPIPPYRGM